MSTASETAIATRKFQFVAGEVCLDFTNTVGGKRETIAREYLKSYGDLLSWCRQAGLLNGSTAEALTKVSARRSDDAAIAFQRAIALREALYRIFAALAHDESPPASDLDLLNSELSASHGRLRVVFGKKGFGWTWADSNDAFDQPLGPIARSAAELLTSPHRLERVHQCEGDTCGWLFLDSTKNHSRRWCVMSDCGNVAKVRRYRQRQRRPRRTKK